MTTKRALGLRLVEVDGHDLTAERDVPTQGRALEEIASKSRLTKSRGQALAPTRLELNLHRGLRGITVRVVGDKTDWNAHRIASRPVVVRPVGNDVQRPRRGEASGVEVTLEVLSLPFALRTVGTYGHRNRLTPNPCLQCSGRGRQPDG